MKTEPIINAAQNALIKITFPEKGIDTTVAQSVKFIDGTQDKLQNELVQMAQNAKSGIHSFLKPKSLEDALMMTGYAQKTVIVPDAEKMIPGAIPASQQINNYLLKINDVLKNKK